MAWKRGVANNSAGIIRKGQIKEYLVPSSQVSGVSAKLLVLNTEDYASKDLSAMYSEIPFALFSSSSKEKAFDVPDGEVVYLHSHEHPRCVVSAVCKKSAALPQDCILLNEAQRVNCKVCTGENEIFTVYQGLHL